MTRVLLIWRRKEPGYQQSWYWSRHSSKGLRVWHLDSCQLHCLRDWCLYAYFNKQASLTACGSNIFQISAALNNLMPSSFHETKTKTLKTWIVHLLFLWTYICCMLINPHNKSASKSQTAQCIVAWTKLLKYNWIYFEMRVYENGGISIKYHWSMKWTFVHEIVGTEKDQCKSRSVTSYDVSKTRLVNRKLL